MGKSFCGSLLVAAFLSGCTQAHYQNASPTLRKVSGASDARTSYVGFNFNFAVDQSPGYHGAESPVLSPTASIAE